LASFLSDVLDIMEAQMNPGQGQGQGKGKGMGRGEGDGGMQLPDIIMSQEQLNKMMEEGMKKGEQGKPKSEGEGKEGEDGKQGDKKGGQKGEGKEGNQENGNGSGNDANGLLYEIYQKQQALRQALEDKLAKEGIGGTGDKLVKQMEDIELDLLNRGFTNQTLQKMLALEHQLLKLENATFQQGQDNKRQSETNSRDFENNTNNSIPTAKQYFQSTEILNRQTLPLQQIYKKKVQHYFKNTDD
jgi:hypothetical protein